jgi:hypothetical protein
MFLGYEQIASTGTAQSVKTVSTVIPTITKAINLVRIQATGQSISYTLDGKTVPTATLGMLLIAGLEAIELRYEDFLNMQFIEGSGGAGKLNIEYYGGPF